MITLKQLAKELNVSVSTVSKALNNSDEISSETIIKVQKLAKELNYKRNKIALSLKSNKTLTLGVILPDILNRFYAKVLYGIQIAAEELGYDIITFFSRESMSKEIDYLIDNKFSHTLNLSNKRQYSTNSGALGNFARASQQIKSNINIKKRNRNQLKENMDVQLRDYRIDYLECFEYRNN